MREGPRSCPQEPVLSPPQPSGLRGSLHPCKLGGGAVKLPSGTEESHALGKLAAIFKFLFYFFVCVCGGGGAPSTPHMLGWLGSSVECVLSSHLPWVPGIQLSLLGLCSKCFCVLSLRWGWRTYIKSSHPDVGVHPHCQIGQGWSLGDTPWACLWGVTEDPPRMGVVSSYELGSHTQRGRRGRTSWTPLSPSPPTIPGCQCDMPSSTGSPCTVQGP